jgi:UDP-N-acetylglucosamine/UDP-N-acetylgalactosamine diphosphorylase
MLAALRSSDALQEIQDRGLRQMFYLQVDSPLVSMCDPEFLGYHLLCGSELSTQVVAKQNALDKVGNVASVDGRLRIIEYSDLPDEAAERRAADGSLFFWAGNTAVHVFDVAFLARMAESGTALPYHRALKKAPYVDEHGQVVTPSEPNAIKFEQFIFDLLPAAQNAIVVEADAAKTFAPVKNGPGAAKDSPETVKAQMTALHTEWLREAGAVVADGTLVEISPLFALDAQQVAEKIRPGECIDAPRYFTSHR